jgi:hypothetical protein
MTDMATNKKDRAKEAAQAAAVVNAHAQDVLRCARRRAEKINRDIDTVQAMHAEAQALLDQADTLVEQAKRAVQEAVQDDG